MYGSKISSQLFSIKGNPYRHKLFQKLPPPSLSKIMGNALFQVKTRLRILPDVDISCIATVDWMCNFCGFL